MRIRGLAPACLTVVVCAGRNGANPSKLNPSAWLDPFAQSIPFVPVDTNVKLEVLAPVSMEDFWTLRREMSDKLNEKIAMLSLEQSAKVRREMLEALCENCTTVG